MTDEERADKGREGSVEYLRFTGSLTKSGPITRDAALRATGLCIGNARLLIGVAEKIEHDSAHATGLAVIALEELAKTDLLLLTATIDRSDSPQWKRFWSAFTSHQPKLRSAVGGYLDQFGPMMSYNPGAFEPDDFARTLNDLKQAAWYVNCVDGEFLGPGQTFTHNESELVFKEARRQVEEDTKHMYLHALFYDDVVKFARGATTVREMWLAQIEIAKYRQSTKAGELERVTHERIAAAPEEQLTRNIFM